MPELSNRDGIHVLELDDTENRFHPDWIVAMDAALDKVVAEPAPLVAVGQGKFYSNGLDVAWLDQHRDQHAAYIAQVQRLYARILTLPVPTATAVNGHAFGAGAMLALAFDWRVMRVDRGFFCLPEIDLRMGFPTGMAALVQAKLSPRAAVDSMTTGKRFGGPEALAAGMVDGVAAEDALLTDAIARVSGLQGKDPDTLGRIKTTMYADTIAALLGA